LIHLLAGGLAILATNIVQTFGSAAGAKFLAGHAVLASAALERRLATFTNRTLDTRGWDDSGE
jgi:hypothetical protein